MLGTLTLSPGLIPSFAVLHTEKAMNLAVLCGDFFLLSVLVPRKNLGKKKHLHAAAHNIEVCFLFSYDALRQQRTLGVIGKHKYDSPGESQCRPFMNYRRCGFLSTCVYCKISKKLCA